MDENQKVDVNEIEAIISSPMNFINGKKTYILGALGIIYAVAGYFTGNLDPQTALGLLWGSSSLLTIRHAISKAQSTLTTGTSTTTQ
jgi:hypothetical protein